MTAPQWNNILRNNAGFVAMTAVLDEAGVPWRVESGGNHPKLVFDVDGREYKHVLSTSTVNQRVAKKSACDIRRVLRGAEPCIVENSMSAEPATPVLAMPLIFEGQGVRLSDEDDALWFVATDVAKPLGYRMASDATRLLDPDEKGTRLVRTPGGTQELSVVSEAGIYKLIARSDKPAAKRFDRWVRHEVLPSIRKHGAYASDPAVMEMLQRLTAELAEVRAAADLALEAAGRVENGSIAATMDLASTVTSDDLIGMAGIKTGQRVRGTSAMVTGRVLTFTAGHGCFKTPAHLNPSMPWRFPREKAAEWLFGASLGAEQIRGQIERQNRRKAQRRAPGNQGHLSLVGPAGGAEARRA